MINTDDPFGFMILQSSIFKPFATQQQGKSLISLGIEEDHGLWKFLGSREGFMRSL